MLAQDSVPSEVTIAQAARIKDVHPSTIRRLIRDGRLPAERFGSRLIRIKLADLDALGREVNDPPPDPIREAALRVVAEAPKLTGEQLDSICALLRGVA